MPSFSLPAGRDRRLALLLAVASIAIAVVTATRGAWLCDDAFICFRYARNWIEGLGLVFNPGERVEGYTNPLWTVWIALGMKLGATPERWTIVWGVIAYAGTVITLLALHREARRRAGLEGFGLPIGALAAALHAELAIYATSGLETSAFTFLAIAGLALTCFPGSVRRAFTAGVVLGLAAVTRHDGVIFAAVAGLAVAAGGREAIRRVGAFGAGFLVIFAPVSAARIRYYGDFFPNTYYAKSGGSVWYAQGFRYLLLYLERYWIVAVGLVAWIVVAVVVARRAETKERDAIVRPSAVLAAAGLVYAFYIVRVGGDFMFARLLLPATVPLLAATDLAVVYLAARMPVPALAGVALYLAALVLPRSPIAVDANGTPDRIDGITDEHAFYSPQVVAELERRAATIAPFLAGLPVRVAFYGTEARFVYRARVAVAIEGHTGLTDAFVAHQPIAARGRVGHEKLAPASYLIGQRRVHLTFSRVPTDQLRLDDVIPRVRGDFAGVSGRFLTWDPELYAELSRRGVKVPDFPRTLDGYIHDMLPKASPADAEVDYLRTKLFYFSAVSDPAREAPFLAKLGGAPPARP
ncbi:hypothetical protein A7982_12223 [Minicystis rosea]|nr:hypothetical protein A7982_12223 [Minicystis rosea]